MTVLIILLAAGLHGFCLGYWLGCDDSPIDEREVEAYRWGYRAGLVDGNTRPTMTKTSSRPARRGRK